MKIIEQKVRQTKAGQDYKVFKLDNDKYLSVFQFDTRYKDLEVGMELNDDLLVYDEAYGNYKLKPLPRAGVSLKGPGGYKPMERVMETKNENIKEAQERKNDAIHKAGAMRDATLVALASIKDMPFPDDSDFKAIWQSWYKYFLGIAEQPF